MVITIEEAVGTAAGGDNALVICSYPPKLASRPAEREV
jgi:hypothetical protein